MSSSPTPSRQRTLSSHHGVDKRRRFQVPAHCPSPKVILSVEQSVPNYQPGECILSCTLDQFLRKDSWNETHMLQVDWKHSCPKPLCTVGATSLDMLQQRTPELDQCLHILFLSYLIFNVFLNTQVMFVSSVLMQHKSYVKSYYVFLTLMLKSEIYAKSLILCDVF